MDLTKAQRLLNKIQAFLDNGNGHELSRLEKDLLKSYVQQLYEAVTSDEVTSGQEPNKQTEAPFQKTHKSEPTPKVEISTPRVTEIPKADPPKPVYSEYTPPAPKAEPHVHSNYLPPVVKEHVVEKEAKEPEVTSIPFVDQKPKEVHVNEPVKETTHAPKHSSTPAEQHDALQKLFDVQKSDEMSSRFGHVPIGSIESAMGLNERIFTLNELFGGDKGLFDAWCDKLNNLNSFSEAKNVLINGPAKDFKWSDPERIKMAEQFIRIVSRRYPKSVS